MSHTAHPYADLFPLMTDAELKQLADDISGNGQREPIYLAGELILDGRNRYRACEMAGVAPRLEQYTGTDLLNFVVSKNLHRRHLTESQRAIVAAELANMCHGGDRKTDQAADLPLDVPQVSQAKAAKLLNVGERTVRNAKRVVEGGVPELADAVKKGEVSVDAAAEVANLPEDEQMEVIVQGPAAVKAKAAEVKKEKQQEKERRKASTETAPVEQSDATTQQEATTGTPQPKQPAIPQEQNRATTTRPPIPSRALEMAVEAINALKRIFPNDPKRKRAFEMVRDFMDHNE